MPAWTPFQRLGASVLQAGRAGEREVLIAAAQGCVAHMKNVLALVAAAAHFLAEARVHGLGLPLASRQ